MTTEQEPEWVSLCDAFNRLCRVNESFSGFGVEAIAKAIQSGHVRLQGVRRFVSEPDLLPVEIDGREIRTPDFICILTDSKLYLKNSRAADSFAPADFEQVKIDWRGLNEFGRDMWPDLWPTEPRRPLDTKVAEAFADSVAHQLQAGRQPTRSEHIRELREQLPGMTERQYDKVRKQAVADGTLPAAWREPGRRKLR